MGCHQDLLPITVDGHHNPGDQFMVVVVVATSLQALYPAAEAVAVDQERLGAVAVAAEANSPVKPLAAVVESIPSSLQKPQLFWKRKEMPGDLREDEVEEEVREGDGRHLDLRAADMEEGGECRFLLSI